MKPSKEMIDIIQEAGRMLDEANVPPDQRYYYPHFPSLYLSAKSSGAIAVICYASENCDNEIKVLMNTNFKCSMLHWIVWMNEPKTPEEIGLNACALPENQYIWSVNDLKSGT